MANSIQIMISSARYWYRLACFNHSGVLANSSTVTTMGRLISGA
jgi:hypothetical protein